MYKIEIPLSNKGMTIKIKCGNDIGNKSVK